MIRDDVIYGEIEGVKEGDIFEDRKALMRAKVQSGWVAGIATGGAAIALNEGYKDDIDNGDVIIYTGEGGRKPGSKKHTWDQTLTKGNLALASNQVEGIPIRVSRGPKLKSPYAPKEGYEYGGLYRIESYWSEKGIDGFKIYRYKLVKCDQLQIKKKNTKAVYLGSKKETKRTTTQVVRVIRDSKVAKEVKRIYDYRCQFCSTRLSTPVSHYAEGCHIKPLGHPHDGKDNLANILCLCPNCHVLFDYNAITLTDDLIIEETGKNISVDTSHDIDISNVRYKREINK